MEMNWFADRSRPRKQQELWRKAAIGPVKVVPAFQSFIFIL